MGEGNVFGGFTAKGWDSKENMYTRKDANAFLFLIRAKTHKHEHGIFPIKSSKIDKALCQKPNGWLFLFGQYGMDLYIGEDCDKLNKAGSVVQCFDGTGNI